MRNGIKMECTRFENRKLEKKCHQTFIGKKVFQDL